MTKPAPMDGERVSVRAAAEADLASIKALRDALYSESPSPPWLDESWERYEQEIRGIVRNGGAFLAERGREAVGFALAWAESPEAMYLGDLYVRPEHRGDGIGRVLVQAVAGLAHAGGNRYVRLTANLGALPFYERQPFAEESRNLVALAQDLLGR